MADGEEIPCHSPSVGEFKKGNIFTGTAAVASACVAVEAMFGVTDSLRTESHRCVLFTSVVHRLSTDSCFLSQVLDASQDLPQMKQVYEQHKSEILFGCA